MPTGVDVRNRDGVAVARGEDDRPCPRRSTARTSVTTGGSLTAVTVIATEARRFSRTAGALVAHIAGGEGQGGLAVEVGSRAMQASQGGVEVGQRAGDRHGRGVIAPGRERDAGGLSRSVRMPFVTLRFSCSVAVPPSTSATLRALPLPAEKTRAVSSAVVWCGHDQDGASLTAVVYGDADRGVGGLVLLLPVFPRSLAVRDRVAEPLKSAVGVYFNPLRSAIEVGQRPGKHQRGRTVGPRDEGQAGRLEPQRQRAVGRGQRRSRPIARTDVHVRDGQDVAVARRENQDRVLGNRLRAGAVRSGGALFTAVTVIPTDVLAAWRCAGAVLP